MQIDLDKLRRLEAKSRREHLVLMDLDESNRHARNELSRRETGFLRWIEGNAPSYLEAVKRSGYNPQRYQELLTEYGLIDEPPKRDSTGRVTNPGSPCLVNQLAELWEAKCAAERLKSEYDAQSERWNGASACLESLREFVKKYGHRVKNDTANLVTPADAQARAQANQDFLVVGQYASANFDPAPSAGNSMPHFTVR